MASDAQLTMSAPPVRWKVRAAFVISLAVHIALLASLAAWYVKHDRAQVQEEPAAKSTAASATGSTATSPKLTHAPEASPEVTPTQVSATLDKTLDHMAAKSDDEKLSLLDKQAERLEAISSEQAVAEIATKFQQWMNIEERAQQPVETRDETLAAKTEFDFDTAQLHDVTRVAGENGEWTYHSVLVDAAGQTFEVELGAAEGEKAFATFERLKRFPLADKVYRQITMPLIDKVLANSQPGAATAPAAASAIIAVEEDDRDPFTE